MKRDREKMTCRDARWYPWTSGLWSETIQLRGSRLGAEWEVGSLQGICLHCLSQWGSCEVQLGLPPNMTKYTGLAHRTLWNGPNLLLCRKQSLSMAAPNPPEGTAEINIRNYLYVPPIPVDKDRPWFKFNFVDPASKFVKQATPSYTSEVDVLPKRSNTITDNPDDSLLISVEDYQWVSCWLSLQLVTKRTKFSVGTGHGLHSQQHISQLARVWSRFQLTGWSPTVRLITDIQPTISSSTADACRFWPASTVI